jgi:serine O-acetyltransferase
MKLNEHPHWGLDQVVSELREIRRNWRASCARNHECGGRELPAQGPMREIIAGLKGALFPMRINCIALTCP